MSVDDVDLERSPFERLDIERARVSLRKLSKPDRPRKLPFKISSGSAADKVRKKAETL